MPQHLTVNCAHCGTERIVPLPAPAPESHLACLACGHGESFEQWVSHTVAELASLSASRLARSHPG